MYSQIERHIALKEASKLKSHIALLQEVCTAKPYVYLVRVTLAIPHQVISR